MMREISLWMQLFLERRREVIFESRFLLHVYVMKLSGREKGQNTVQWLFECMYSTVQLRNKLHMQIASEHRYLDRANKISPADEIIKLILTLRERHDQIF